MMLTLLFKIPTCSTLDQEREFVDGIDLTDSQQFKDHRKELESYLNSIDSIMYKEEPVVPPQNSHVSYLEFDTLYDGTIEMIVKYGEDRYIKYVNYNDDHNGDSSTYSIAAFDSKQLIMYIKESKRNNYFKLFGISLPTGNKFTVFERFNKSFYDIMYSWTFSPDFQYLLKTGDLQPGQKDDLYGWSIVNLKDGSEGKVRYERYKFFISNPQWIDGETFKYTLLEIPFSPGEFYNKDYRLYYALINNEPFPAGIKLKYNQVVYPKVLTFNVKGHLLSEKMIEYDTGLTH